MVLRGVGAELSGVGGNDRGRGAVVEVLRGVWAV